MSPWGTTQHILCCQNSSFGLRAGSGGVSTSLCRYKAKRNRERNTAGGKQMGKLQIFRSIQTDTPRKPNTQLQVTAVAGPAGGTRTCFASSPKKSHYFYLYFRKVINSKSNTTLKLQLGEYPAQNNAAILSCKHLVPKLLDPLTLSLIWNCSDAYWLVSSDTQASVTKYWFLRHLLAK